MNTPTTTAGSAELDKVTQWTLSGVDGHVLSIKREYDTLARLEKITSYSASDQ